MILPAPDPIPLPGPAGLLQFLLVLGWFLHALPMYGLLGGSLIALVTEAMRRRSDLAAALAGRLWAVMPAVMGVAITFGIVPLLFLQVLYGQAFFTAAVLAAWPWLSVIPALLLAYYGYYAIALWGERLGRWRLVVGFVSFALIGWVGYQFTNLVRLVEQPVLWPAINRDPALQGFYLAKDAASLSRYLLFFGGALGLAGGLVVLLAGYLRRWGEAAGAFTARVARYGGRWALAGLALEVLAGAAFVRALGGTTGPVAPGPAGAPAGLAGAPGGPASPVPLPGLAGSLAAVVSLPVPWGPVFWAWAALTVLAAVLFAAGQARRDPLAPGLWALGLLVPAVALSAVLRLWLREAALAGFLEVERLPVVMQTGPFLLFAGGLVLAIAVMTWVLAVTLRREPVRTPASAGADAARRGALPAPEPAVVAWAREAVARLFRPRPRV